jgi:aminoglycoside phosphotransferase (APT) family kinase protein
MAETASIRQGEEFDTAGLWRYLRDRLETADGEIEVEQFPAGSSNLTYLVRVGTAEYVLRRPPFGNTVKTAHDMRREFETLSKLSTLYQPAPKPLLLCDDESIIGSEFYLMERRRGLIIRGRFPDRYILDENSPPDEGMAAASADGALHFKSESICRSFIKNLADLHSLDYAAAGLSDFGRPEGYNRRQVEGWTKRYFAAKTHELETLEESIKWLNANIPLESGASLIHNDYKFDNVMLDPEDLARVTAVLDWEMVTIGDPLMDFGTTLGYWMSPDAGDELLSMPFNPRVLMENVTRRELVDIYEQSVGRNLPEMAFYYVFGTVKIAVIAQQIYARFVRGFTQDQRFEHFDRFVERLGRIAANSLEKQNI